MLQSYITHSMNAAIPKLNPISAFFMNQKEYAELIGMLSELNVVIKGQEVYVNEKTIERKGEYLKLIEKINKINKISMQLMEKA